MPQTTKPITLNIGELLRTTGVSHHFALKETLPPTEDLDYASPIVGYLTFHRTSNMLIIRGELEAAIREQCVRCLEEVILPLQAEVEEEYTVENYRVVANASEEGDGDTVSHLFQEQDLLLEEFIRQQLYLAKPEYPVCAADCKGICPRCGADLNTGVCVCEAPPVDVRLARLAEIYRPD